MGKYQKHIGIDERQIKCCCDNENCIESGLTFTDDEDDSGKKIGILKFFFLEPINEEKDLIVHRGKHMYINKESILDIIKALKDLYDYL